MVEHLYQARLGRIEDNAIKTLSSACGFDKANSMGLPCLENQLSMRRSSEVRACKLRIARNGFLEMVEKAKQNQVKPTHTRSAGLRLRRLEVNIGDACEPPEYSQSAVHRGYLKIPMKQECGRYIQTHNLHR